MSQTLDPIEVRDNTQLKQEFSDIYATMQQKETDQTWESMEKALRRLEALGLGGAHKLSGFVPAIQSIHEPLINSISTERTRLSTAAVELIETLARVMHQDFIHLLDLFIPSVLRLCGRTNKVFVTRATKCLTHSIKYTQLAAFVPHLTNVAKSPSKGIRHAVVTCLTVVITEVPVDDLNTHIVTVEKIIHDGLSDSASEVRGQSREAYVVYAKTFEDRVPGFLESIDPKTRNILSGQPTTGSSRTKSGQSSFRQFVRQQKKAQQQKGKQQEEKQQSSSDSTITITNSIPVELSSNPAE